MTVLALVIILLFLAGVAWLVNVKGGDKVPATFKFIINAVLIIVALILVLAAFGIWDQVKSIQVPKI